jgi:SPP1 family predicted phage head-tail adaptor
MSLSNKRPPSCAADLRASFTSQRATVVDDNAGGQVPTWSTLETGFCAIVSQTGGGEGPDRDRLAVERRLVVWIRYGHDLTEKDRLILPDGLTWQIRKVDNYDFGNAWLRVECEAGVPVNG